MQDKVDEIENKFQVADGAYQVLSSKMGSAVNLLHSHAQEASGKAASLEAAGVFFQFRRRRWQGRPPRCLVYRGDLAFPLALVLLVRTSTAPLSACSGCLPYEY